MIIRRLQSENLLCFEKLDLRDLPADGRILITGGDEAGKSAILEILCLALYGRTANLPGPALARAIRWGQEQGSATLEFQSADATLYTLTRRIDAHDHHEAQLTRGDHPLPLVQGVEAVNQAIRELLGCEFEQYVDTLYLTQGRHAHHARPNRSVKVLANAAVLEDLGETLSQESAACDTRIQGRTAQQQSLRADIAILNVQETVLVELEESLKQARSRMAVAVSAVERWLGFDAALSQSARRIEGACTRLIQTTPSAIGVASWWSRCQQLDGGLKEFESLGEEAGGAQTVPLRQWQTRLQGRLEGLDRILESVGAEQQRLSRWLGETPRGDSPEATLADALTQQNAIIDQATRQRKRRNCFSWIFLLLALVASLATGIAWQQQLHGDFAPLVTGILARHIPYWPLPVNLVLLPVSVLLTVLMLSGWIGRAMAGHRIRGAEEAKGQLDLESALKRHALDTL
ncbi:MAG: AAA family ATPase, partial [Magnetococcales bacterium]|nr:AAA family ATPase [Magnetococcales bacterium]